eukprot:Opistho-1_new@97568
MRLGAPPVCGGTLRHSILRTHGILLRCVLLRRILLRCIILRLSVLSVLSTGRWGSIGTWRRRRRVAIIAPGSWRVLRQPLGGSGRGCVRGRSTDKVQLRRRRAVLKVRGGRGRLRLGRRRFTHGRLGVVLAGLTGGDAPLLHVVKQLTRDFRERFPCERELVHSRGCLELAQGHKLHNIALHETTRLVFQRHFVRVKNVHVVEFSRAHSNDHDRDGEGGQRHNFVDGRVHVIDDAVRDDEQYKVLVAVGADGLGGNALHGTKDPRKDGGPVECHCANGGIVGVENAAEALDHRVVVVHVAREAVLDLHVRRDLGAESVHGVEVVRIIARQDFAYGRDGLHVLIGAIRVNVVQRVRQVRRAVGGREIDGDDERQLKSTPDKVEDGVLAHDLALEDLEHTRVLVPLFLRLGVVHEVKQLRPLLHRIHRRPGLADEFVVSAAVPVVHNEAKGAIGVAVCNLLEAQREGLPRN